MNRFVCLRGHHNFEFKFAAILACRIPLAGYVSQELSEHANMIRYRHVILMPYSILLNRHQIANKRYPLSLPIDFSECSFSYTIILDCNPRQLLDFYFLQHRKGFPINSFSIC